MVVLDTLNARLVEYRNSSPRRSVPVAGLIEGRSVAVTHDGIAFVYDVVGSAIFHVDVKGTVTRYPAPEGLPVTAHVRLRQGAGGKIVLAVDEDEYDIGPIPDGPRRGPTFEGHAGRHVVMRLGRAAVVVQVDGRERWRVTADGEVLGSACSAMMPPEV